MVAIYACHSSPIWRGRCQEVTELYTSPPHDWWPPVGPFTDPPDCTLAKGYTGRCNIWCEMIERDILCWTVEEKKPSMTIITLSTLIRIILLLASAIALIKSYILKWPLWHCDVEIQDEMKVCHFSPMIALLSLAIMTTGRRVFATDVHPWTNEQNGNKNSHTACHFQSDSSPSAA